MKTLEEKRTMLDNFEGFYVNNGHLFYENPNQNIVVWDGDNRFEKPNYISNDCTYVMGRSVQYVSEESLNDILCNGGTVPVESSLFNNNCQLYILNWDNLTHLYQGKLIDVDDLSEYTFEYDGNNIINWTGTELNNNENVNKNAGGVFGGTWYKTVPNNPTQEDIDKFLFNPDNCYTINLIFNQIQTFLIELSNLYEEGIITEKIPQKWFSNATKCSEQALILDDNLLQFYVNVFPDYFVTWNEQKVDIDSILKLYN